MFNVFETSFSSRSWRCRSWSLVTLAFLLSGSLMAQRVTDGLVVLYDFQEGSGSIVNDVSGIGSAQNLTIADPGNVSWIPGGGLSINSGTIIESSSASKVFNAIQATDAYTLEVFVQAANNTQDGPARMVTMSVDPYNRNATLGQENANYISRTRADGNINGVPDLSASASVNPAVVQHVVMTRGTDDIERIIVNGVEKASWTRSGNCSGWDASYGFALFNEFTMNRAWLGDVYLVSVYDKALSMSEINQNRTAFLGGDCSAGSDHHAPTISGVPADATASCGALPAIPGTCTATAEVFASSVKYSSGVKDAHNTLGAPDGHVADFYDSGDKLELEFDQTVPAGTEVCVTWKRRDYTATTSDPINANAEIWEISGGSYHQTQTLITAESTSFVTQCFLLTYDTDYLKIKNDGYASDFEVDAVSYRTMTCEPGSIIVMDNCDPNPSVSFNETTTACVGGSYTVTRTWTAMDASGNSASASQVITVIDNDPPVLSGAPADMTVDCGAIPPADSLTALDGCSTTVCDVLGFDNGSYRRSLWLPGTGIDNNYEWVGGAGQFEVFADGTARLTGSLVNHTDASCGWDVEVWFSGAYDWAAWSAMGRTYKPGPGTTGTVYEDWTFYEVDGTRSTLTGTGCFAGDLLNLTNKPSDFSMGLQIGIGANDMDATYGMSFWFYFTGTLNGATASGNGDFNLEGGCVSDSNSGLKYTYWESSSDIHSLHDFFGGAGPGTPTGTGIIANAQDADREVIDLVSLRYVIRWNGSIEIPANGTYTFYLNSDDGSRLYIDGNLVVDNDGLHAVAEEHGMVTLLAGCYPIEIQYFQDTGGEFLATLWEGPGIAKQAIPDSAWKTSCGSSTTGIDVPVIFTETSTACSAGSYTITRTWTATDACGNAASHSQVITVEDHDAPVLSMMPADLTLSCSDSIPAAAVVTANDNCDMDVMVTFNEVATALLIERTWTATDDCGNSVSHTQTITLDPDVTDPVLVGIPADTTVACDMIPAPPVVTANDDCDGPVSVTFTETYGPGPDACRTITRTWTAMDAAGNSASASQIIVVEDNVAPTLVGVPMNVTISCGDPVPAPATVTAMDNCDASPVVTFSETSLGGIITRTWTATDACGNSASAMQTISLDPDLTEPVLNGVPGDVTVSCDSIPAAAVVTAMDDCDGPVSVTFMETYGPGPDACRVITRTWTAMDAAGNTASATQLVTVQDNVAPTLIGLHPDVTVECGNEPAPAVVTAIDNCDNDVPVMFSETTTGSGCVKTITRTWTATDDCGNTASATQTITVEDTQAPWFSGQPASMVLDCTDAIPPVSTFISANDNCDGPVPLTFVETIEGSTIGCYDIVRRWTATDACGNSKVWAQFLSIVDTVAPVLSGVPADVSLACGEPVPAPAAVTALDECDDSAIVVNFSETTTATGLIRTWTAMDSCGNMVSDHQTITIGTDLSIAGVSITAATGCTAKDGTVTIDLDDAAAGVGPYTVTINGSYTFGPFATEPIVIDNAPGGAKITSITVDDAGGCQATDNTMYEIGEPDLNIAGLVINDADCATAMGSVVIDLDDATAGMPPYTVLVGGDIYGPYASEPITIVLAPGTYTKVGVRDSKGCSDLRNVTVNIAPPTGCGSCPSPTGTGSLVNGRHTADVFWDVMVESTGEYILEIREIGTTDFTVISVMDTIQRVGNLNPCSSYEWCVRTVCGFDTSDCSALQTFTTDCSRTVGGDFVHTDLYPNPTASVVYLSIDVSEKSDIQLEIYSITGQLIHAETAGTTFAHQASLDLSGHPAGMYLAKWLVNGEPMVERFVFTGE